MSADRDRGIRRQKQKRAKDLKRQARRDREAVAAAPKAPGGTPAASSPAASA